MCLDTPTGIAKHSSLNIFFREPTPEGDGRMNTTRDYALGLQAVAADLKLIPNQRLHCAVGKPY